MAVDPCVEKALKGLEGAGYLLAAGVVPWGRPGHPVLALTSPEGSPLVAKLYPDGRGRATYDHIQALCETSFGRRRGPPRLPRAVAYMEELGALIMERLDGRPLGECGPMDGPPVMWAMELLAALHASGARPPDRQTADDVVCSLRGKVGLVRELAADIAEPFCSLVHELELARPPTVEAVPSHGDFCPRNLFMCSPRPGGPAELGTRLALIDWDHFRLADPAHDIGSFVASSWGRAIRYGRTPDWSVLEQATTSYGSLLPMAAVDDGIRFYTAVRLARMSHILLKRPRRAWQVPLLLDEAHRLLR